MSDFDRLYDLVDEMNRKWSKLNRDIESGRLREIRAQRRLTAKIIDDEFGTDYGTVTVDGNGFVVSIDLEADAVYTSSDDRVLSVIAATLNSDVLDVSVISMVVDYEV